tara:strand:+ start:1209 stop:1370 length:162 start_codon:yes stop_codon:yes gene_type:complete
MDIKYNVSKYKDSKIQELKDSVSIEEPLEMRLKFKKKWQMGNAKYFHNYENSW